VVLADSGFSVQVGEGRVDGCTCVSSMGLMGGTGSSSCVQASQQVEQLVEVAVQPAWLVMSHGPAGWHRPSLQVYVSIYAL